MYDGDSRQKDCERVDVHDRMPYHKMNNRHCPFVFNTVSSQTIELRIEVVTGAYTEQHQLGVKTPDLALQTNGHLTTT